MLAELTDRARRVFLVSFRRLPVPWRRRLLHLGTPSWTAGAVVIVRDGTGRVLLVRSRHHHGWGLPGGLLRRGEEPSAAALRELHEEIGLRLTVDDVAPADTVAHLDAASRQVTALFQARLDAQQCALIRPDGVEVVAAEFYPLDALPAPLTRGLGEQLAAVR